MHILLTGGTGFIGRHLIERLHQKHEFTVVSRHPDSAAMRLPDTVTIINDLASLDNLNQFDAIINLAGEPIADKRWTQHQRAKICDSRWEITSLLVSKINASSTPPKVFISGSAIGYYGRNGDTVITEDAPHIHKEFSHEICAKWEAIAQGASQHTRVCLLRTGVVLGKKEGALGKMTLPFSLGLGGKIGSGRQYMSWIHIDDMVAGIIWLLENNDCSGAYNLTAPTPVTNTEFVKTLGKTLHRPAVIPVPALVLKLAMGDAADLLLTGQRVIPQKLLDSGFTFTYPQLSEALAAELR